VVWDIILPNCYTIPNPIPPPFHDLISIPKALKWCPSTSSDMDTVLKKHTTSIFRQLPEDASSRFP